MNEKHLTPAEALATEHARTIWWARRLTVPGNMTPALQCGACQEVYAELNPSNLASTMGTADQIQDEATLQLSDEAAERCITRLAEHLMRHRRSQIAQLL